MTYLGRKELARDSERACIKKILKREFQRMHRKMLEVRDNIYIQTHFHVISSLITRPKKSKISFFTEKKEKMYIP